MAASSLLSEPSTSTNLPELDTLGRTLRDAREAQGLSLEALAARLNMGLEQLQALEAGDREHLREPVFVIAQARRVAGALGVNVDGPIEALRRNPGFQAKASTPATKTAPQPLKPTHDPDAARPNAPLPVKPALLALVVAGGVAGAAVTLQRNPIKLALPALPTSQPAGRPPSATPPVASPLPSDTLVLTAKGRSWVEVNTSTGQTLFRGTLQGEKTFPMGQGLKVLAGRPDLVSAQVGAGEPRLLGRIDQIRWQRFAPGTKAPAP